MDSTMLIPCDSPVNSPICWPGLWKQVPSLVTRELEKGEKPSDCPWLTSGIPKGGGGEGFKWLMH